MPSTIHYHMVLATNFQINSSNEIWTSHQLVYLRRRRPHPSRSPPLLLFFPASLPNKISVFDRPRQISSPNFNLKIPNKCV